jgi:hypothetical protein
MNDPIFCAFFTKGTLYEQEAARLRASLDSFSLPHDIVGVDSLGDWASNASLTADFCLKMIQKHAGRPVVYLDADAVVRKYPQRFYELDGVDIAAHWVNGNVFANGTVYFGDRPLAMHIAERYRTLVNQHGGRHPNEQLLLEAAIKEHVLYRVERLPSAYCYIHDICNAKLADDEIVIEHLQASREWRGHGEPLDNRRKRIAGLK